MEEALTCGELVSVCDGGVVLCLVVLVLSLCWLFEPLTFFALDRMKDPTHSDWLISWGSFRVSSVT